MKERLGIEHENQGGNQKIMSGRKSRENDSRNICRSEMRLEEDGKRKITQWQMETSWKEQ